MSRTSNQTLPYWQFEVGLFDDGKTIELSDKYGPLGEAILFRIMCYITQSDGYFAQLNNALILYVYRSIGNKWIKDKRIISEVIHFCGVCGLFDVNLLSQNVITSQGIQRRWLSAKKKSRAQGFLTTKYWLLNENEPLQGELYNNADNCNNNADNCNNNADIKERKDKVINNISLNACEEEEKPFKPEEYQSFIQKYGIIDMPMVGGTLCDMNFKRIAEAYSKSTWLRTNKRAQYLKFISTHYHEIVSGYYEDKDDDDNGSTDKPKGYWDDGLDKLGRLG